LEFVIDPDEDETEGPRKITFTATTDGEGAAETDRYFYLTIYPKVTIKGKEIKQKLTEKVLLKANTTTATVEFNIAAIYNTNTSALGLLQQHALYKD
jgi:hypothetical protein